MKKLMITAFVLVSVAMVTSCQAKDKIIEDKKTEAPAAVVEKDQTEPIEKEADDSRILAYQGKVDHVQTGIGGSMQEVIKELGEPTEIGHFEGSSFLTYPNLVFMLEGIIDDARDDANIAGIVASEGYELYGVKVGMTMDEIKQVLGAPQQEYKEGEDEGDIWKTQYDCGTYKLIFYFDERTSPSTSAYLSRI